MSRFVTVIPARFGSTRLPGKPLVDIEGEPMVVRVWRQALKSSSSRVVVATDDARVGEVASQAGAEVIMTRPDHPNGTSRLADVAEQLGLDAETCMVNVQGDEPLIPPELIDQVAHTLHAVPQASIATLAEPIDAIETLASPHVVKVVCDRYGRALYFSRAPIPWQRDAFTLSAELAPALPGAGWHRHIGLYAYRVGFLQAYVNWPEAPLEQCEQLEQLRALYHGHHIQVTLCEGAYPPGVDTQEDLERVRGWIRRSHGEP
ncbi:3-deoxy-manno-octulosonate cytidylyltransferase [Larsenimonas rhizosphaerae]|uniref:3-deoxy-manno-octulosonate cytidylyltransferase n=1 Tax=Larsenimonas rhizosphaerae TaxID=2944682 RepID=UPI002034467F|nr:3-deoxy-manno-octulosonate cytidylyltransferase [Larsenimonas rhizosphaerae]MCM2130974.1 3-deoxy-manno-octulosonate cytidylyltransferase [Larsenimonas rhizosphaerae]